jgi:thiamine-phosphate pyrophosphorylase
VTISASSNCAESEAERTERLAALSFDWVSAGVDFLQIREKDLSVSDLTHLTRKVVGAVRQAGSATKVIVNAEPERALIAALEAGADGIHLSGGSTREQLADAIRGIHERFGDRSAIVSVACHSVADVRAARSAGADLAIFAPVFEKSIQGQLVIQGSGLGALAEACHAGHLPGPQPPLSVLALGGVTRENAEQCMGVGAAGIAAIRLFIGPEWPLLREANAAKTKPVARLLESR